MVADVRITVRLPVEVNKKGAIYVSKCPALDVYSQGNTEAEAIEHISEALRVFLESCFERRVLDDVLQECGIKAKKEESIPDREPESQGKSVEILLPLMAT